MPQDLHCSADAALRMVVGLVSRGNRSFCVEQQMFVDGRRPREYVFSDDVSTG